MLRNLGFWRLATIRVIATSNPKQEQNKPPREPVKSSRKETRECGPGSSKETECNAHSPDSAATTGSTKVQTIAATRKRQNRTTGSHRHNESRGRCCVDEGRGQTSAVSDLRAHNTIFGSVSARPGHRSHKQDRVLREPIRLSLLRRDVPMKKRLERSRKQQKMPDRKRQASPHGLNPWHAIQAKNIVCLRHRIVELVNDMGMT